MAGGGLVLECHNLRNLCLGPRVDAARAASSELDLPHGALSGNRVLTLHVRLSRSSQRDQVPVGSSSSTALSSSLIGTFFIERRSFNSECFRSSVLRPLERGGLVPAFRALSGTSLIFSCSAFRRSYSEPRYSWILSSTVFSFRSQALQSPRLLQTCSVAVRCGQFHVTEHGNQREHSKHGDDNDRKAGNHGPKVNHTQDHRRRQTEPAAG